MIKGTLRRAIKIDKSGSGAKPLIPGLLRYARNDNIRDMKQPCVYILANKKNGTLYTGVTSNLAQRISQHKQKISDGFTQKYDCQLLVYYEPYEDMESAIMREKQIKAGSRAKKISLIEKENPNWDDLFDRLI